MTDKMKELEKSTCCNLICYAEKLQTEAKVKKLEEGIHLLIDFIPDGWEVPVGWTTIVSQVKKLIEKEK